MTDYTAYDEGAPCKNPNCNSYGQPHPNCRCYSEGGQVCSGSHKRSCEFHVERKLPLFANGGTVDDAAHTVEHHIANSGFHGFLTKSSKKNLANPSAHLDTMHKAKMHMDNNDHGAAASMLKDHPLSAGANEKALAPILNNIAGPLVKNELNPDGFKSGVHYINGALKGEAKIKEHASNVFQKQPKRRMDRDHLNALKKELTELEADPSKILEIAEGIGHYLPGHSAQIGAQVAKAVGYLNSIKPMNQMGGPLDKIMKPSVLAEYRYNKALDIAEDPLSVIHHAKDGTLEAQDLVTLNTLYPKVAQGIMQRATETLLEKPDDLSMKDKRALSSLLGQPLMYSQTPESCQAIMRANANVQTQEQQQGAKKPSRQRTTAAELKQIDQVNKLYATPLQERQIDHKD